MSNNFAINNKTDNLIFIVNKELDEKMGGLLEKNKGIRRALLYRIFPFKEIDTSDLIKKAYEEYYGEDVPRGSDTIFNAFIPFRDFCISRLKELSKSNRYSVYYPFEGSRLKNDLNQLIYLYLDDIFNNCGELRKLFEGYFELMYSFSNFMPVPIGFNGNKNTKGKGTYDLNKDYPSMYLKNLKDNKSGIYKREEMLEWLEEKMNLNSKYKINDMYSLQPPYGLKEYFDDSKLISLMKYIEKATELISCRFEG